MKRGIGLMVRGCAVLLGIGVFLFVAGNIVIEGYNPKTGITTDMFGRQLHPSTGFMGRDLSPGVMWEVVDVVCAVFVFGVIRKIYHIGTWLYRGPQKTADDMFRSWQEEQRRNSQDAEKND